MPTRKPGWEARLAAHLERWQAAPFAWGVNDCVTFAAGAVRALDPAFGWQPDWTSESEAVRALARAGGMADAVSGELGTAIDNWRLMQRGDIALFEEADQLGVIVCSGRTLCGPGPGRTGLQHIPLRRALKAWLIR